jgi:putative sterol carrier protein
MTQQHDADLLADLRAESARLSDAELAARVDELGRDRVLGAVFAEMERAFLPERAEGVEATVQYDVLNGEPRSWSVEISGSRGTCTARPGPAVSPRVTLGLALPKFLRLMFGQVNGMQLFLQGQIKLKGDMFFAQRLQGMFRQQP